MKNSTVKYLSIPTDADVVPRQIFFFDVTVANLLELTSSLPANAEMYLIDPAQDGLEQIALKLEGRSDIDAIHLFSHGSASVLQFGSTTLSHLNINSYAPTLSQIGASLSPMGDILLYGCNVGEGADGQAFVESIARLTQADVAASDDVTGSAALGGNWALEVQSGAIESTPIAVAGFEGVLANSAPVMFTPLSLSFGKIADYLVGTAPSSLTGADVNGDSKPDVVVANESSDTVSVLLNNGDGTFAAKVDYATGLAPQALTTADFNGDGKLDLAVADKGDKKVAVLLNAGNGTFAAKVDYAVTGQPTAIVAADVNGDGKRDLLVTNDNDTNTLSVLLGVGDGTFAAKVDYATGAAPRAVATADVNGDGNLDAVTANWGSSTVSVLLGNGDGTFAAKVDYNLAPEAIDPCSLSLADVNGDGKSDIMVANRYTDSISVLMNSGDGTFAAKVNYSAGDAPRSVTSADLNGDSKPDMMVVNEISNNLSVLLNKSDGTFAEQKIYALGTAPRAVVALDVNGDGMSDVLALNKTDNKLVVMLNSSTTVATTSFIEQTPVAVVRDIVLNDPDGNASWNGGSLKLQITANAEAADSLSLATANSGDNGIWLDVASGNKLMAGTTHIGDASAASASNGAAWTLTFNTSATNLLVQDVARAITFNNSSNNPSELERTVTFTASDSAGAAATFAQHITVTSVNELPTLTAFSGAIGTTTEESTVEITFAELAAKGDEADSDGTVTGFVVKHLNSGILKIGGNASIATPFDGWRNNTIDASNNAYWTPAQNVSGTLNSFTAVARDNGGDESATAVQATVTTTAVHDAPVMLRPLYYAARTDYEIPYHYNYGNNGTCSLYAITSANVNSDGSADLVVTSYHYYRYYGDHFIYYATVFLNNGSGLFNNQASCYTANEDRSGVEPWSVLSTDVNGGGKADIVAVNHGADNIAVFINNGDGLFAGRVEYATGDGPYAASSADINGDGYADVMVVNEFSNTVSVLMNRGDGTLAAKVDYATGDVPRSLLNMDINNDGKADLVVANTNSNTVSMWLNKGDGTFLPRTDFVADDTPRALSSVDVNRDGFMDLVVANQGNDTLSVMVNNGAGSFLPRVNYAVGDGPLAVTSADINGDGYADLATANYYSDTISVLLNRGDGTFAAKVDFAVGDGPLSITSADMNGDGLADLAVVNQNNNFSVLLSTLQTAATQFTEQTPVAVCDNLVLRSLEGDASWNGGSLKVQISANANADDSLTLATSNLGGSGIWLDVAAGNKLMAGNVVIGSADVASASSGVAWTLTFNSSATNELVQRVARAVTFVNNSNNPSSLDRTVTLTATDNLGATTSIGQVIVVTPVIDVPTFTTFSNPVDAGTEDNAVEVTFAELLAKGDEAAEDGMVNAFVVKAVSSGSLKIGADAATATAWSAFGNTIVDATHRAYWMPVADANGTLNAFTAVARDNGGTVSTTAVQATVMVVSVNDLPGVTRSLVPSFAAKVDYATGSHPYAVISQDSGNNGKANLVVANIDSDTLLLFLNKGDSTFAPSISSTTGNGPRSITSADLNGDGVADLVVANYTANTISVLSGGMNAKVDVPAGSGPISIVSVDINHDGLIDLVTANQNSNTVSLLLNRGDGTFAAKVDFTTGNAPQSVIAVDVNNDGWSDLVTVHQGQNTVSVLLNKGNSTFEAKVDYATGGAPQALTTADFNGDGRMDLAVANTGDDTLSILLNSGNGVFAVNSIFATGDAPQAITSADINGDGKADLAVANYNSDTVSLFVNNGDGTFASKADFATGDMPNSITSTDINGDGKADLAVTNYNVNTVSVLLNTSKAVEQTSFARKTAVSVASDIVMSDADGNAGWNGGTLKAQITANAEAADSLNMLTTNPGGSGIWLNTASGNKLMAGDTEIGSANASTATNDTLWTFTFNSRTTGDMVQSVARALTFTSNSDASGTADRTITITATDNSGQSGFAVLHHSDAVLDSEFGTNTGDVIAPMLDSFLQADAYLGVAVDSNLELLFNEAIQRGSGLIQIHRDSVTGSVVESFDAATSANIAIAGNKLTINPAADLKNGTLYFVTFDTTAINDMAGNSYAGTDICHFKTDIPDAAYHNLTGGVTFWKNDAAVSDVTTTLMSQQATQLVEFRNIHLAADGSRTLELWATSPSTTVNSLQLEFVLPEGSNASWQSGTALPAEWTLLANTERAGQFILAGMSTTALPSGDIKLGTLALTATTNPEHDELLLSKGFIGQDTVPGFAVWPESVTSTQPGLYQYLDMLEGDYTLTGAKLTGRAESNAVNANDALAALKLAVAFNPNADGSAVLPYQFLAADVNQDGQVKAADALNILKMAVKLSSAPQSEWLFVSESTASAIMDRNTVDWSTVAVDVTLDHDVTLDLIGIVKGDVDGSWAAAG